VANQPRLAVESIAGRRPYQEDALLAETLSDGRTLLAVADGMGGHAAGEVASKLALDTLQEAVGERLGLVDAFRLANERVHVMAQEPGKQGMGTTLVAILVEGSEYRVANVGDSRVYLVSGGGIRRLTEDHSFVAEAVKRGQSEAEAMATPWKDALTRSIGTEVEVEADVSGPYGLEPDSALVLCSDGLYKTLGDNEIRDLFGRSGGTQGAAQSLVAAALDAGSDDNITVVIAEYGEVPRHEGSTTMVLSPPLAANPRTGAPEEPESRDATAGAALAVDEGSLLAGFPVAALAAIVAVVTALVAIVLLAG
jgi:serine/threonine protein phosphatase PrpC